jgi:hypothetical protein
MMSLKLIHLEQRIKEIESLADEVLALAESMSQGRHVQPDLSVKGERWYRGAREILVQQDFSGIKDFDGCYKDSPFALQRAHKLNFRRVP